MSLFDRLVAEALGNRRELGALQAVVAKELLHHDILREMAAAGLLKGLTFIGGTCLRACYGSSRLSEDLDFTGGENFCRDDLSALGGVLVRQLEAKYGLAVTVSEPIKEVGNVATWKVKVDTHPQGKSLPSQRINIDICALPSYERRPMMLRNIYGVDMGTSGLILQVQSREEVMVDKIVALALRPNRLKNRDVWDLAWLRQQGVSPATHHLRRKLGDRQVEPKRFVAVLQERLQSLEQDVAVKRGFFEEMRRFLPGELAAQTLENEDYWTYLCFVVREECEKAMAALAGGR
jgi:predicted nucleotidyltransferase component of viral defense system